MRHPDYVAPPRRGHDFVSVVNCVSLVQSRPSRRRRRMTRSSASAIVPPNAPADIFARPAVVHAQPVSSRTPSPMLSSFRPPGPPSGSGGGGWKTVPPSGGGGVTHLPVAGSHFCGAGHVTPAQRFTQPKRAAVPASAPASGTIARGPGRASVPGDREHRTQHHQARPQCALPAREHREPPSSHCRLPCGP